MSIATNLQNILSARYGRDVRQAIHDSISNINTIAASAEGKASTARDSAASSASAAAQSSSLAVQAKNQAEQFKNQAFSATPEGYQEIVNKVNSIYRVTTDTFGDTKTVDGSMLIHKVYGMSIQNGIPSPSSPIPIEDSIANFRCLGKNMLALLPSNYGGGYRPLRWTVNGITFVVDNDGVITVNGTADPDTDAAITLFPVKQKTGFYAGLPLIMGKTYRLYLKVLEGEATASKKIYLQMPRYAINGASNWDVNTFYTNPRIYTHNYPDLPNCNVRVVVRRGSTVNNVKVLPMLTIDDDTEYEFPKYSEVKTNIELRSLEVQADDDYNLEKDGKYYISDTLDWDEETGYKITRRVGHVVLDGTENWSSNTHAIDETGNTYRKTLKDNRFPSYSEFGTTLTASPKSGYVVSSNYPECMTNGLRHPYLGAETIALHDTEHWIQIYDERYNRIDDVNYWKDYLSSNPLTINYRLVTPVTEKITSEQAQALLNAKTYNHSTYLFNTESLKACSVVELEYAKDRGNALALTAHNVAHKNTLRIADANTALMESLA